MGWSAAAMAVSSIGSAVISSNASSKAAKSQQQAAETAAQAQLQQFHETKDILAPYVSAGLGAQTQLQELTGTNVGGNPLTAALTAKFNPTMEDLAKTPGYQFALDQGLQATQNSYAAQGLGVSGAAMKGAANYAEGLASTTYQQQFQNYLAQNQQIANILGGQVTTGENAAATTGSLGQQAASTAAGLTTSGAAAGAAGIMGSANAYANGLNNLGGIALAYGMYK
jgi:hypothetical protein